MLATLFYFAIYPCILKLLKMVRNGKMPPGTESTWCPIHSQSSWLSEVTSDTHSSQPFFSLFPLPAPLSVNMTEIPSVWHCTRLHVFLICAPEVTFNTSQGITCFAQLRIKWVSFKEREQVNLGENFRAGFLSLLPSLLEGLVVLALKASESGRSGESPHGQTVPSALWLGGPTPLEGISQACCVPLPVEFVTDGEALPGVCIWRTWLLCWVAVGALYLGNCDIVGQGSVWIITLLGGYCDGGSPALGFILLTVRAGVTQFCFSLRMAAWWVLHFTSKTPREGGSVSCHLRGSDTPCVNTVCNTCVFCCFHGHPKVGIIAPRRRKHKAMRLHDGGLF